MPSVVNRNAGGIECFKGIRMSYFARGRRAEGAELGQSPIYDPTSRKFYPGPISSGFRTVLPKDFDGVAIEELALGPADSN